MKINGLVFKDRGEISRLLPLGLAFENIGQAIGRDKIQSPEKWAGRE